MGNLGASRSPDQYTSEAARFWSVAGVMSSVMTSGSRNYAGLPAAQQEIENHWDRLSRFAQALFAGQNPGSVYVGPNAGTISNATELNAQLWMSLGNPAQESATGDWWHTEL